MRSGRWLRLFVAAALALGACSGGDDPVTIEAPDPTAASDSTEPSEAVDRTDDGDPSALPPMLSAGPEGLRVLADGAVTTLSDDPVDVAHDVGDGRIATDVGDRIRLVSSDGRRVDVRVPGAERADEVDLLDAFVSNGRPLVVVATASFPDDEEPSGDLLLLNLETGLSTRLGDAIAPEYGVGWADHGGGVVAVSAFADLTETVTFVSEGGATVDAPSPTDGLAFNAPPLVIAAAISADGARIAWLEGPDFDGVASATVGDGWDLVVAERETLAEVARVRVAGADASLVDLDLQGRWAVITVEEANGIAVDVDADAVVPLEISGHLSFVESELT